jgi:hypothetical protein
MNVEIPIILRPNEVELAGLVARTRHNEAIARGLKDKHGAKRNIGDDYLGAKGEIAAILGIGLDVDRKLFPYRFINAGKVPNLGPHIEVRTRSGRDPRLIFRKDDNPKLIYVLVYQEIHLVGSVTQEVYVVSGWSYGHEMKRPEWLDSPADRPAAWFQPKHTLRDIREIPIEKFDDILYPNPLPGTWLGPESHLWICPR